LPEPVVVLTPFERAAGAIEEWLDGAGATFATRTRQPDPRRKVASWDLNLEHELIGPQRVSLYITRDFPATPPQVRFDKKLCLVLPHIEADGRFCHGVEAAPEDYDDPVQVAVDVLKRVQRFWSDSKDPKWVLKEFHRERLAYWLRFCEQFRATHGALVPFELRAELTPLEGPAEGKISAYFRKNRRSRSDLMVATVGEMDPHGLSVRHGWSVGTLVRGHALFVPIPADHRWAPGDWPRTLQQLENLVGSVTDHQQSVTHWIASKKDESPHPLLVFLVQNQVCYGYLVVPPAVPRLMPPAIVPVAIDRVDADWTLARDHQLGPLRGRRAKRVLLLGCGSLGAPVAELLARAGAGTLHLLDKELFGPENCVRHLLGASDIGNSKAGALAKRLRQLVPGINVKAYQALATDWVRQVCKPGVYDLVVDCTGESAVRVMLARYREHSLGDCQVVHAWMEPFCAAAHVVLLQPSDIWPLNDPRQKVNVATWPDDTQVNLPACSIGFHPYGAADVWQAAGFTTERLVAALDGRVQASTVWSWVRSSSYFAALDVDVKTGPLVPKSESMFDASHLTRPYASVFGNG